MPVIQSDAPERPVRAAAADAVALRALRVEDFGPLAERIAP